MRTKVKKLTSVILAVVMMLGILTIAPLTVSAATYGDFEYTIEDNSTCTITYYKGFASSLSIPSQINGYRVVKIGSQAFTKGKRGNETLVNVTIPNTVTTIGEYAFQNCTELTTVNIPNSVINIEQGAFFGCIKLSSNLILPNSVTNIGKNAFNYCSSLSKINIPDSVYSIGSWAFRNTKWYDNQPEGLIYTGKVVYEYKGDMPQNTKITLKADTKGIAGHAFYDDSGLKNITIPNGVKSIGASAFCDCSNLSSITIPEEVKEIGNAAFWGCSSLVNIVIPNGITSIKSELFKNCSNLESITISNKVKSIGEGAFSSCSSLKKITIPGNVTSISWNSFYGCTNLSDIVFSNPNNIVFVGGGAFEDTQWLKNQSDGLLYIGKVAYKYIGDMPDNTNIILKNGTLCISGSAFDTCEGLKSITIPNTVTNIGEYAFSYCTKLKNIVIPNTVTEIGYGIFSQCENLTNVTLSNSIKDIPGWAFAMCKNLTSISIPSGVTEIGSGAFTECENLASISIPDSVAYIWENAFEKCMALTRVTIPSNVESIGSGAFADCSNLSNIIFLNAESTKIIEANAFNGTKWYNSQPNGVIYIGNMAYTYKGDMPKNTRIELKKGTTSIGSIAFYGCKNLISISIPNSVTTVSRAAFYDCTGLENIVLPNTVKRIDSGAFSNCSNMTSISLPNSIEEMGEYVFSDCIKLKSVTIPDEVTSIGEGAFLNCTSLANVTISKKVRYINNRAFMNCINLKSVTVPKSIVKILNYAMGYYQDTETGSYKKIDGFTIKGYKGTAAEEYAKENGFKFIALDVSKPTSVSLNKTSLTLDVGKSYTLTKTVSPSNAVTSYTWSSSNTSVANVDGNGKVTAKASGTATITVKTSNGKTATCKVTVNLPAPQITGLANTTGGIKISWNKVDGAYGYRLYYKPASGGWKRFKDTTATSFTDSGVVPNKTETYTIRCIDKNGNTISGFNSNGWSKKYTPAAPTISKLENTTGGIKISWNKIAGVYGYRLYYKTSSGGWKRFKDTTATSFTDSGVSPNRTETYTIRCIDKNGNTISGFNSTGWSKKYTPVAPTISKLDNTSGGIKLSWNKIAGVYGYRLYYKTSSGGWKRFKDTTATSFTDSGVSPNRTETYTIRCIDKNGNTVSGFYSKGWSMTYTPVAPTITRLSNTSKGVSVTWNKIAGVYGYRLYRKYDGGSWTKVKDTTSTSFTDSGAKKGKKATYTVRCIDRKGKTVSGFNSKGWSITRK